MSEGKPPVTAAVRVLREQRVIFSDHLYPYEAQGGAPHAALALGVDVHCVIKTLIMEDHLKRPLIVLMYGDKQVSVRELARVIGVKSVAPCDPAVADKHSGYRVGGTSPFGTHRVMPVYMEAGILELPRIFINGGKRGYLVGLEPSEVRRILQPTLVRVAIA